MRWRGLAGVSGRGRADRAVGRPYWLGLIFWKARLTYVPSRRSRCVLAVRVAVMLARARRGADGLVVLNSHCAPPISSKPRDHDIPVPTATNYPFPVRAA